MNLCIISGKVINEIDLEFVYNLNEKTFDKKHISIVIIYLKLDNEKVIRIHAYNELADYIYQNIIKGDYIIIEGKVRELYVEAERILQFNE